MLFSIIVGILMPQLIATYGATKSGWTILALIYAVPMAIIGSIRMFTVKEVVNDGDESEAAPKTAFRDAVKALARNNLIFLLGILVIVYQMVSTANGLTYYFKWIFGDIGLVSLLGLASLVKKLGTSKLMIAGMVLNLAGCLLRMLFPYNIAMLMVAQATTLIGMLPVSSLLSIYTLECMAYGQTKTGVNIDGVTSSVSGFAMKVGSALGSAAMGFMMSHAGYISDPAATAQPDSALGMIRFMFATLPAIFAVVMLVVGILYSRTKRKVLGA